MTAGQVRGMDVFFDKAKCDRCHEGSNFTLNAYSNLGVGTDKPEPDVGRFAVTKDPRDWGVFKTPTLREIEHTAPYMHDGSLKTLEEVVDFYNKGGIPNKNLDANIKKLNLSDAEKKDLVEFMKALSGEGWQQVKPPASFPAVRASAGVQARDSSPDGGPGPTRSYGKRTTVKFFSVTVSPACAVFARKSTVTPAVESSVDFPTPAANASDVPHD